MHLKAHLRFHFREQLKMRKNTKKKMHFTYLLIIHLAVQSRSTLDKTFNGAPKDALRDHHKDPQKGACKVAL